MYVTSLRSSLFLEIVILSLALLGIATVSLLVFSSAKFAGHLRDAFRAVCILALPFCVPAIVLGFCSVRFSWATLKKDHVLVANDRHALLALGMASVLTSVPCLSLIAAMCLLLAAAISGKSAGLLSAAVILLAALVIALFWLLETGAAAIRLRSAGSSCKSACLPRPDQRLPQSPTRHEARPLEF
jgi:hypothetical protein